MRKRRIRPIGGYVRREGEGELAREMLEEGVGGEGEGSGAGRGGKGEDLGEIEKKAEEEKGKTKTSANLDIENMLRDYLPEDYTPAIVDKKLKKWVKMVFRKRILGVPYKKRWLTIEEIARYIQDSRGLVSGGDADKAVNELFDAIRTRAGYSIFKNNDVTGSEIYTVERPYQPSIDY